MTGTMQVDDALEHLPALCLPTARVMLVGPNVGLVPDTFLHRGVDVLGGYTDCRSRRVTRRVGRRRVRLRLLGRSTDKVGPGAGDNASNPANCPGVAMA
jgi:uncharacterized protein